MSVDQQSKRQEPVGSKPHPLFPFGGTILSGSEQLDYVCNYLGKHETEQKLAQLLALALKNSVFCKYHNLGRNYKCGCTPKEPCAPRIDDGFILELLKEQKGRCRSCDTNLILFQDNGSPRQPVQVFTLPSFQPHRCKIMGDAATRTVEYIFCHACSALLEACYFEKPIFNHYRHILIRDVDGYNRGTNVVDARYFPRLDQIDRAGRSVRIVNMKSAGKKRAIYTQWLRQAGCVVYPVPVSLQSEVLQEKLKIQAEEAVEDAVMGVDGALSHNQAGANAHRVQNEAKSLSRDNADIEDETSSDDDDDGEDDGEDDNGGAEMHIAPGDEKDYVRPAKRRKVQDEGDGDDDGVVEGRPEGKAAARAPRRQKRVEIAASDLCENNAGLVCFKIPIDPRKSAKSKCLSYVALTARDRNQPVSPLNFLFTTQLLASLEDKLEYGDFIRWAIVTLRRKTPDFVLSPDNAAANKVAVAEIERKDLARLREVALREKQLRDQGAKVRAELKLVTREKQEVTGRCAPQLLRAYEANEDLSILRTFDLVPRLSNRQGVVKALTEQFVADCLPALLAKHQIVARSDAEIKRVYPRCIEVAKELFSDELRGRTPSRVAFTLKLASPPPAARAAAGAGAGAGAGEHKSKSKKSATAAAAGANKRKAPESRAQVSTVQVAPVSAPASAFSAAKNPLPRPATPSPLIASAPAPSTSTRVSAVAASPAPLSVKATAPAAAQAFRKA